MAKTNTFLFIEPEQHYLIYGSCYMRKVVEANRKAGMTITELKGAAASPSGCDSARDRDDPIFIEGVGHGNTDLYSVECMAVWLRASDTDRMHKLAGRVVFLNSCKTAVTLGKAIIDNGGLAYYGSKDLFYLLVGQGPCANRLMETVFRAEYTVEDSLMKGKTTGEAQTDRMRAFDTELNYWQNGEGRTDPNAGLAIQVLTSDKSVAVMYGKSDVKVTGGGAPSDLLKALALAGFGLGAVVAGYKAPELWPKGYKP